MISLIEAACFAYGGCMRRIKAIKCGTDARMSLWEQSHWPTCEVQTDEWQIHVDRFYGVGR